jgi:hypothetical protein
MPTIRFGRAGRRTVAVVGATLATAAAATAAAIYTIPGSPGGPPTPAQGVKGTSYTNYGVTTLGNALAGFTAAQLVQLQTVTLTVRFPRAGTIYGRIGVTGVGELGEGFAGRANGGLKPMSVSLSAKGRSYLLSQGTNPVQIHVRFAFQPNVGPTEYSNAEVTTAQG